MIEILTTGYLNSVQDLGREGLLHLGVSRGGAMDPLALKIGNHMVGNDPGCAGIEVALFPFRLRFHRDTAFAVTGAICESSLDGVTLPPWWAIRASAGQTLSVSAPTSGSRAYVCVAGGIDVPQVLGSRSTDQKAGFGGRDGRGLSRGDRFDLHGTEIHVPQHASGFGVWPHLLAEDGDDGDTLSLRVLPAAEFSDFDAASQARFYDGRWTITAETNRIGCRLTGEALSLRQKRELFSHGILPGVVQVPPSGLPIVQMADANTCGGYPKIANIIGPDIRRLAQATSGTHIRFVETTVEQALSRIAEERASFTECLDAMSRAFGLPTAQRA